jgi:hypothetical protein
MGVPEAIARFATLSRSNDRMAAILIIARTTSTALMADALQRVVTTGAEFHVATKGENFIGFDRSLVCWSRDAAHSISGEKAAHTKLLQ